MRLSPALEVAPRTAVTVTVLAVLLASVVAGNENPQPPPAPAAIAQAQPPARAQPPAPELDLERIRRSARQETIPELFTPRRWQSASPVAKPRPGPPPAPSAPPLPFSYLGKLIDGERTVVFLARGDRTYSVEPGKQIDDSYRLERAQPAELTFTYLPLGTRQALAIPALN